ncbi:hypothetical protein BY996DRAFT_6623982, partial [Phakopsora pachyrhizi]
MEDQEGKIYKEIFCKSKRYIVAMEVVWIDLAMDDNDNEVTSKVTGEESFEGAEEEKKLYNDRLIGKMSKESLKELKFYKQDAGLIIEDMDVMKDFEQHVFASCYKIKLMKEILKDCERFDIVGANGDSEELCISIIMDNLKHQAAGTESHFKTPTIWGFHRMMHKMFKYFESWGRHLSNVQLLMKADPKYPKEVYKALLKSSTHLPRASRTTQKN